MAEAGRVSGSVCVRGHRVQAGARPGWAPFSPPPLGPPEQPGKGFLPPRQGELFLHEIWPGIAWWRGVLQEMPCSP